MNETNEFMLSFDPKVQYGVLTFLLITSESTLMNLELCALQNNCFLLILKVCWEDVNDQKMDTHKQALHPVYFTLSPDHSMVLRPHAYTKLTCTKKLTVLLQKQ